LSRNKYADRQFIPLRQFLERRLIPDDAMPQFNTAIASSLRLRNSLLAELLLIALVYGVGILIVWRRYVALDTASWYATPIATDASSRLQLGLVF
jgi:hypothetical protein